MLHSKLLLAGLIAAGALIGVGSKALESRLQNTPEDGEISAQISVSSSQSDEPKSDGVSGDGRHESPDVQDDRDDTTASQNPGTVLGVHTAPVSAALRSHLRIQGDFGLRVTHVEDNSAASVAGLTRFDVLMEFDGQQLVNSDQFTKVVRSRLPGDTVSVRMFRGGRSILVDVVLTAGLVHDDETGELTDDAINNLDPLTHFRDYQFRQCARCHDLDQQVTHEI